MRCLQLCVLVLMVLLVRQVLVFMLLQKVMMLISLSSLLMLKLVLEVVLDVILGPWWLVVQAFHPDLQAKLSILGQR